MFRPSPGLIAIGVSALLLAAGCGRQSSPGGATDASRNPESSRIPAPAPAPPPAPVMPAMPPASAKPVLIAETDPTVATFAGLEAPKPAAWKAYVPGSAMRAANYIVPAPSGKEEDQLNLVVFQGIGGGRDANIARWQGQFQTADGQPVQPKLTNLTADGLPVTIVELTGEYQGMGASSFAPDQTFLGAYIERPEGDIQIRLVGPAAAVKANEDAFIAFVKGIHHAGS